MEKAPTSNSLHFLFLLRKTRHYCNIGEKYKTGSDHTIIGSGTNTIEGAGTVRVRKIKGHREPANVFQGQVLRTLQSPLRTPTAQFPLQFSFLDITPDPSGL